MQIVGLSGYARSGKDEAAKVLVEEFGFVRVAFADKLREVLYALNPTVLHDINTRRKDFEKPYKYLQDVIDEYGWDGYKETVWGPEIRRLLQRLGTEAGRQTLWDSIWVDATFAGLAEDAKVVVTDCRFENEAQAVKERGGQMWRVNRTGVGPANNHPSETSLDDWNFDWIIKNDTTLEEYHETIRTNWFLASKGWKQLGYIDETEYVELA